MDHAGKEYIEYQKEISDWFYLEEEKKSEYLNKRLDTWNIALLMQVIFERYSNKLYLLARYFKGCSKLKLQYPQSHRIAVYYYRYGKGGVERVLSYLLPLFVQAGYDVVLITDEEPEAEDYLLPPKVKRYSLPKQKDVLSGRKSCGQRVSKLLEILKEEKADTLCYHAASNPLLFYDLVAAKSMGIKVVISKHELFSQYMASGRDMLTNEIDVYPLADMLTVLSREEEVFWSILGIKSIMIPNPAGEISLENYQYNAESANIVWVGRLDSRQKQYQEIVPIMREVVKERPDCIINIYGNADGYQDKYLLENQIKENGLEKNIKYRGYSTDIKEIYKDAGVLLITSAYESSPMIILESKQLGIPLVTYSMPYLELLKNRRGFIEVEQGDTLAAARAVIKILSDPLFRTRLSSEAKWSVADYSNGRTMEKWDKVFLAEGETSNSIKQEEREESYRTILRTLIFHQSMGCQKYELLREKYEQLKIEQKLNQIKEICETRRKKLAVYPYGMLGRKMKGWIEEKHMEISLIVDNHLAEKDKKILSLEKLKEIDVSQFLFIICSDSPGIYEELREGLYEMVPQDHIFDWFPRDEERM